MVAEPLGDEGQRPIALVSMADGTVRKGSARDLKHCIEAGNHECMAIALRILHDIGEPLERDDLINVYTAQGAPEIARIIAAVALGETGDRRGEGLLIGFAQHGAQLLRDDPSFDIKATWLPVLGEIIGHNDETEECLNISEAVRFLPTVADEGCVPLLAQIGARSRRALRDRAHDAVVSLGAHSVRLLLPLLAEDQEADAGAWAAGVICDIGSQASEAVGTLTAVLERRDAARESVRAAAARALGGIGADAADAVPTLQRCLTDPSERVRKAASSALSRIASANDAESQ